MKNFSIQHLAHSVNYINSLSIDEKLKICDRISIYQPYIFAHALELSARNVPFELLDHVLRLLLVFYHRFTDGEKIQYPVLCEEDMISADNNTLAMFRFFENEEPEARQKYITMSITNYPEPNVFAYMINYLAENGFVGATITEAHGRCIRAAKNIFDSFCRLKKEYQKS